MLFVTFYFMKPLSAEAAATSLLSAPSLRPQVPRTGGCPRGRAARGLPDPSGTPHSSPQRALRSARVKRNNNNAEFEPPPSELALLENSGQPSTKATTSFLNGGHSLEAGLRTARGTLPPLPSPPPKQTNKQTNKQTVVTPLS